MKLHPKLACVIFIFLEKITKFELISNPIVIVFLIIGCLIVDLTCYKKNE